MVELCSAEKCTGCGACYNCCPREAISMQEDGEKFLRPVIDANLCVECRLCQRACPVINPIPKHDKADRPIALVHKDRKILLESTSGGAFSLMACWIIDRGGVIYGAMMTDAFDVCHVRVSRKEELAVLRGSKYAQSNTNSTFRQVKTDLEDGKYVLYTGTPCQIAGLIRFLGCADFERLYTVDLVCYGTPSVGMFKIYLEKLAQYRGLNTPPHIRNFRFRQTENWGLDPSFEHAGRRILCENEDRVYLLLFHSGHLHRPCCYSCQYTSPERVSDVTIADFWGIGTRREFPYDVKNGCSLVLTNTEKGQDLFKNITVDADFDYRDWNETRGNHQLYAPSIRPKDREKAIESLFNDPIERVYAKFFNTPIIRIKKIVGKILKIIGIWK